MRQSFFLIGGQFVSGMFVYTVSHYRTYLLLRDRRGCWASCIYR